jgi:hypothetical protein
MNSAHFDDSISLTPGICTVSGTWLLPWASRIGLQHLLQ